MPWSPVSKAGEVSPSPTAAPRASVGPEETWRNIPFLFLPPRSPLRGNNSAPCGVAVLSGMTDATEDQSNLCWHRKGHGSSLLR